MKNLLLSAFSLSALAACAGSFAPKPLETQRMTTYGASGSSPEIESAMRGPAEGFENAIGIKYVINDVGTAVGLATVHKGTDPATDKQDTPNFQYQVQDICLAEDCSTVAVLINRTAVGTGEKVQSAFLLEDSGGTLKVVDSKHGTQFSDPAEAAGSFEK